MAEDNFVRWQAVTRDYLSATINLFLGLSIAAIGFSVSLIRDCMFNPNSYVKFLFTINIFSFSISIVLAICVIVNRLISFKKTMKITRLKELKTEEGIKELRAETEILDKRTWNFFWFQFATFFLGVFLLAFSLILFYRDKLF